jgi:hypothetical protein
MISNFKCKVVACACALFLIAASAADDHLVKVNDDLNVRFMGIGKIADETWYDFAGKKVSDPASMFGNTRIREIDRYQLAFRVEGRMYPSYVVLVAGEEDPQVYVLDDGRSAQNVLVRFGQPDGQKQTTVTILVAQDEWQTLETVEPTQELAPSKVDTPNGSFAITRPTPTDIGGGGTIISVATDYKAGNSDCSIFAVDNTGAEHFCANIWNQKVGSFQTITYHYDVPIERISAFAIKVRPYKQRVVVKDLSLDPAAAKMPKMVVEKVEDKK